MANQYTSPATLENFWRRVDQSGECWVWTGTKDSCGYGMLSWKGKIWRAHRLSYMLEYGVFDYSMKVLHKCDNPPCVRPDHLFIGTQQDNVRDMVFKNRHGNQQSTIDYSVWLKHRPNKSMADKCKRGHTFTLENTRMRQIRDRITRVCKTCQLQTASNDRVVYKVKSFVRGVENRKLIIDGLVEKIYLNGSVCWYCQGPFECLDHFIPKSHGGEISIENINPSCNNCNQSRKALFV